MVPFLATMKTTTDAELSQGYNYLLYFKASTATAAGNTWLVL